MIPESAWWEWRTAWKLQ